MLDENMNTVTFFSFDSELNVIDKDIISASKAPRHNVLCGFIESDENKFAVVAKGSTVTEALYNIAKEIKSGRENLMHLRTAIFDKVPEVFI